MVINLSNLGHVATFCTVWEFKAVHSHKGGDQSVTF